MSLESDNPLDRAASLEALLFVGSEPLSIEALSRALLCSEEELIAAVGDLQTRLDSSGSSLQILSIAGGYQLATRPAYSVIIGRLLARQRGKLSRPALETLSIIAYRQPITQPEIEAVRGVGCASVLTTLIERELIEEAGRRAAPGRPILYRTTQNFLHYFALEDLADLPPLEDAASPDEVRSAMDSVDP